MAFVLPVLLFWQVSTTLRSVFYLEGMVRLARGEVAEMEEGEDADLFVKH